MEMSTSRNPGNQGAASLMDSALYFGRIYMVETSGRDYFDSFHIESMRFSGDYKFIFNTQMNEEQLIGVESWVGYCYGGDGGAAIGSFAAGTIVDFPFARRIEKCGYKARLAILLDVSRCQEIHPLKFTLCVVCYDTPPRTTFWNTYIGLSGSGLGSEVQVRTSEQVPPSDDCHNIDRYSIPPY